MERWLRTRRWALQQGGFLDLNGTVPAAGVEFDEAADKRKEIFQTQVGKSIGGFHAHSLTFAMNAW